MTGRGNNTYLVIGAERDAVLIDAGVGKSRHLEAIGEQLSRRRVTFESVIVTHAHADHASGATTLGAHYRSVKFLKCPWPSEDQKYAVRWEPIADGDEIGVSG